MGKSWKVPASSGGTYTVLINDDDHISCNCPSWTTGWRKRGSRACKHTDRVVAEQGLRIKQRGDLWFVTGAEYNTPGRARQPKAATRLDEEAFLSTVNKARDRTAQIAAKLQEAPTVRRVQVERVRRNNVPGDVDEPVQADGEFISPMLASKMPDGRSADSYSSADWIMEEKYDGHRIVLRVNACRRHGEAQMHNRQCGNFIAWSRGAKKRTLPDHIADAVSNLVRGVYDGEIVVPAGKSYAVTDGANKGTESLVLFDLIEALGQRVTATQRERRKMLEMAWDAIPFAMTIAPRGGRRPVILAEQFTPSYGAVKAIWDRGGEGGIIKRLDALYRPDTRSPDWIKVKKEESAVITITGFEDGKSGPFSVVVGVDKNGIPIKVKTLNVDEIEAFARPISMGWKKGDPHPAFGKRLVVTMQERTLDGKARHAMWERWAGEQET